MTDLHAGLTYLYDLTNVPQEQSGLWVTNNISHADRDGNPVQGRIFEPLVTPSTLRNRKLVSTNLPTMATDASPSVEQHAQQTVSELFDFITKQGNSDYIGEAVSQLEHSLQAGHLAVEAGADEETILGALLHDVGRFIPEGEKMPAIIAPDGTFVGRGSHEVTGERYLRQMGFSDKVCQLVRAHVMAKRYLTAVDKDYYDALSQSSKTTLKYQVSIGDPANVALLVYSHAQGGIFNDAQVKEAQQDPFLQSKLAVRRWDDAAKIPNMKTRDLGFYEPMAVRNLCRERGAA